MHNNLSLCIYLRKLREITPSDKKIFAVPLFFRCYAYEYDILICGVQSWNIVESDVKHHNPLQCCGINKFWSMLIEFSAYLSICLTSELFMLPVYLFTYFYHGYYRTSYQNANQLYILKINIKIIHGSCVFIYLIISWIL